METKRYTDTFNLKVVHEIIEGVVMRSTIDSGSAPRAYTTGLKFAG